MAYSDYYYLHASKKVQALAAPYMGQGHSLYWIWKNVQLPVFPISYTKFVDMLGEGNLDKRLADHERKRAKRFKYCKITNT